MRRKYCKKIILFSALLVLFLPLKAAAEVLVEDTVWSGEVVIEDNILVPEGVTLTVLKGARINIVESDRTRSDPEFFSPLIEITVRGRLEAKGSKGSPVIFHAQGSEGPGKWAGIIVDSGEAGLRHCEIQDAETAVYVLKGFLYLKDSDINNNRYGVIVRGQGAGLRVKGAKITGNDYGVFGLEGAELSFRSSVVEDNGQKDWFLHDDVRARGLSTIMRTPEKHNALVVKSACGRLKEELVKEYKTDEKETTARYNDEVLLGDTVWRGRIEVNGLVRVPEGIRLIIAPGTIVEFRKKDTNRDGIGENGILSQGVIIAKATEQEPIIFRSAEKHPSIGDWDAVNIMNSDRAQNLIEFVQIQDAYRGLHFHFSNVAVNGSVLRNNYRAVQFQESTVEMRGNYVFDNKSGIKARDSDVAFNSNYVFNNINGVSFFRTVLTAGGNNIIYNARDGLRIREGATVAEGNVVDCNRFGVMINDSYRGSFSKNSVSNNIESGISIKDSDNIAVRGNFIQAGGINGVNLNNAGAVIRGNLISDSGERGIAIQTFSGMITDNSITGSGLYAVEVQGSSDVSAPDNWWGEKNVDELVLDKKDEPHRGELNYEPVRQEPPAFTWPLKGIFTDVTWSGRVVLEDPVTVHPGAVLKIAPASRVALSKGVGITVDRGKIIAAGEKDKRVVFTSAGNNKGDLWDEILIEHADGSGFSYCDFERATWAVHSHFTPFEIKNCRFRNNVGGIRFRSGPVIIRRSLFEANTTGIRSFRGSAIIRENDIINNETGVFVREKGSGLTFRHNNIHSNTRFSIRVGDFNVEDVDARHNWWGTERPEETILDGRDEPGVGRVIYEPYLDEKVNTEMGESQ